MRGWPVPRPTHAPATSPQNKRQQRPPKQKIKTPRAAAPEHVKESPYPPNPSCSRSRGGMRGWPILRPTHAPATTLKTNGNSVPPQNKKTNPLVPSTPVVARRRMTTPVVAPRSGLNPSTLNSSCSRSRGGMRGWPVPRPTHALAIVIRINRKRIPHRHSGISAARRACLPIEVPGEFFTRYLAPARSRRHGALAVRVRPTRLAESGAGVW